MSEKRDGIIRDCMSALNAELTLAGLEIARAGSPTYNKLCGHIDQQLVKQAPKARRGRPAKDDDDNDGKVIKI